MKKQPSMTEPLVIPVKPEVKPVPQRETQKPAPRRGVPWTVPGPKVNTTPKAIKKEVMKKGKMIISNKAFLDLAIDNIMILGGDLKTVLFKKFELTDEMTKVFIAEKAKIDLGIRKCSSESKNKFAFLMN